MCVNSTPHRALFTLANIFSRVVQRPDKGSSCIFSCGVLKQSSSRAHVVSHILLDHTPFSLQHDTPTSSSLLYPPNRTNPCAPQPGLTFGRFAEQSPLTGYEPRAVRRLRPCSLTLEEQVLVRLAILARTSSLPLLYRRWMQDQNLNAGLTTVNTGETQVQPH